MPAKGVTGRIGYTVLFFVVSFIAWILRGWADEIVGWVPPLKICKSDKCFGVLAIYRVCFTLAAFHLVHAIIFIGAKDKSDPRMHLQDGWWLIKIGIFFAGLIGAFAIPNEFYEVFGWISIFGAGIFILVQLLLLVDFAHSWAEKWITNYEETEGETNAWWFIMLGTSITLFLLGLVASILMYVFFVKDAAACQLNAAFITLNLVFCILTSALSILPKVQDANPKSGLLQASFIAGYATYLVWSAMMSESSVTCNPFGSSTGASTLSLVIGTLFTVVAVCFSTFSAAKTIGTAENEPLINKEEKGEEADGASGDEPAEETGPVPYNLTIFHLIFALGSLYICMLMSDWFTIDKENEQSLKVDSGMVAVWVKIVSGWIALVLYAWTLAGPVLFPDRDWGYKTDNPYW